MTAATMDRKTVQRTEALQRANHVRVERAAWKRALKEGTLEDPFAVLLDPPPAFQGMDAFDMLVSVPRIGRVVANQFLRAAGIGRSMTLGGLTSRQRVELARILEAFWR